MQSGTIPSRQNFVSQHEQSFGTIILTVNLLAINKILMSHSKKSVNCSTVIDIEAAMLNFPLACLALCVYSRERLTEDKGNISTLPPSDNGVIDMGSVVVDEPREIVVTVKNESNRKYFFGCVVLGSASDFNVENSKYEFKGTSEQLSTTDVLNGFQTINIPVSILGENPGKFHVVLAFWFKSGKGAPFHIVKFIKVEVKDDVVNSLQPISSYQKRTRACHDPAAETVEGEPPPR